MAGRKRTRFPVALAAMVLSLGLAAASPAPEAPVADAAAKGDVEAVRTLLRQGEDANTAQPDGMTALHWAAQRNQVEVAEVLLYAGATLRPMTRMGGYTPLHLAARSGNTEVARTLLEAGADPDFYTATGVTALHFAAQANVPELVSALVEHGADPNAVDGFSQRTPLMFAAAGNSAKAVGALVEAGADMSIQTAIKDYEEIVRVANEERQTRERVRRAAEPPTEGDGPETNGGQARAGAPQQQAAQAAQANAEPDDDEEEVEEESAKADDEEAEAEKEPEEPPVKALSSTEQIGKQGGFTALHYAAREGHIQSARVLVEGGADVNQVTGGDQSSPMLVAVINGNYDLARMLLEHGADPNIASDDGAAPLFATLNIEWSLRTWYPQPQMFRQQETSYLEFMELLLEAGADPNARTSTHIWYAAYNAGRMGVDFTGATPFWRAAYATDVKAMKLLASHGADPNISTIKLPDRRRFFFMQAGIPVPPGMGGDDEEEADPSGLPEVPVGGEAVHPIHAAAGVGFGTSRVAQQHRAVPDGWLPAMKYFVEELGIDPNLRDKDGYAPLHHAAARGDNATILYLVSQGADVTLIARSGQTTADMANSPEQRAQAQPATVVLLEKLGSKNNHNCRSCGS